MSEKSGERYWQTDTSVDKPCLWPEKNKLHIMNLEKPRLEEQHHRKIPFHNYSWDLFISSSRRWRGERPRSTTNDFQGKSSCEGILTMNNLHSEPYPGTASSTAAKWRSVPVPDQLRRYTPVRRGIVVGFVWQDPDSLHLFVSTYLLSNLFPAHATFSWVN